MAVVLTLYGKNTDAEAVVTANKKTAAMERKLFIVLLFRFFDHSSQWKVSKLQVQ